MVHTPEASAFSKAVNAELRAWMGRRRFNQTSLAEASGVAQQTISRTVVKDERTLDTNQLYQLCAALDVNPADILAAAARATATHQNQWRLAAKEQEPDVDEEDYQ